jgi:hypothetical protein
MVTPPPEAEIERSAEARTRAERALIELILELQGKGVEMVVLGGLVPEVLTEGQDPPVPPHLGTTDVDLLLRTQVGADGELAALESALLRLDFRPEGESWRWRGLVQERAVKIEFLCDLPTEPDYATLRLPGCKQLGVKNLRGTGYVALDWTTVTLAVDLGNGETISAEARFARLAGYLMSKCAATRSRAQDKDFYDLAYVLLHNQAGGPREAAAVVLESELREVVGGELHSTLIEVHERFRSPTQAGPTAFAEQSLLVDPAADEAELKADAVAAAKEFFGVLFG